MRYSQKITFLEAVAEAGGVKTSAWERRGFIVRGRLTAPTVIPVSVRAVMMGAVRDVALEPGDIVLVPKTALAKFEEVTEQILPFIQGAGRVDEIME